MAKLKTKKMINEHNILSAEIHYFKLVYSQGSISSAARQLGQDSANISRMIARLEASVGEKLFVRHKTGLHPTAYGERLYISIIKAQEQFARNFSDGDQESRTIRIGFASAIGHTHFSSLMTAQLIEMGLEPEFTINSSMELIEKMKSREIDFALVHNKVKFPGLISKKLAVESLALCSVSGKMQETVLLHPNMLTVENVMHSIPYKQKWMLKDYFVLAKMLTTDPRLMGVLPEGLLPSYPQLKRIHTFKDAGKITALSWPGSVGVELMRKI